MIYSRIFNGLFKIILNSPYFIFEIYIFRWYDFKDEEIFDPIEKI